MIEIFNDKEPTESVLFLFIIGQMFYDITSCDNPDKRTEIIHNGNKVLFRCKGDKFINISSNLHRFIGTLLQDF